MSRILFLGDFFYDYVIKKDDIMKISEWIRLNDYKVILNLETSLVEAPSKIKKRGAHLLSTPITIDILKDLNVVCVCLANNHFMDYGEEGAIKSLELLDKAGILHVGAGRNVHESLEPVQLKIGDESLILTNYGWDVEETVYASNTKFGCAPLDREKIVEKTSLIRKTNPGSTIVNVFHWGFEFNEYPMPLDIQFAHGCIDAGCDLIIGHHPHVLQPRERYNGKNIYYSLGNFYFGSMRKMYFRELYGSYCDFGCGVVLDLNDSSTSIVSFDYKVDDDETGITIGGRLNDITGCDYNSPEYYKKVKNSSGKPNPILTTNYRENKIKLRRLRLKYWFASKLQFLKKSSLGSKLYGWIKKHG